MGDHEDRREDSAARLAGREAGGGAGAPGFAAGYWPVWQQVATFVTLSVQTWVATSCLAFPWPTSAEVVAQPLQRWRSSITDGLMVPLAVVSLRVRCASLQRGQAMPCGAGAEMAACGFTRSVAPPFPAGTPPA